MGECGRLRPRASEPLKQDVVVVVVAILVDVVAGVVDDDYDDMMMPWESVAGSIPGPLSL